MSSGIHIRPMTVGDLDAVVAMEQETAKAAHWGRADYLLCVQPEEESNLRRLGIVAEYQDSVAGFAVLRILLPMAELESVVVDGNLRRVGIGAALMAAAVESARQQQARRLELEVRQSNRAAIAMYERAGLHVDGERPGYYSNPEEGAVLMSLTL